MNKKKSSELQHEPLNVMCVDDEAQLRELLADEVPRFGHRITTFEDGASALQAVADQHFDCALIDLKMPGMDGLEFMARLREEAPNTQAIMLTGNADLTVSVQAMRLGAFDFLEKPCKLREVEATLLRVVDKVAMMRQCQKLERQIESQGLTRSREIVGQHESIQQMRSVIQRIAPTNSTVLILGETGTGKELVARAIHNQSQRQNEAFVAVNCGALPENLIESELFGHQKGAFTGADQDRLGLFEVASGGTLFLDEIGELPKPMQAKLLRVLESGEIRRVGETLSRKVDCRIVCATHRDLPQMVAEGDFREDLMYRINTFEIQVPPLRERASDIPALAIEILQRFRPQMSATDNAIAPQVMKQLTDYAWPGNVRELANVMEHASVMCDSLPIQSSHLPSHFGRMPDTVALNLSEQPMTLKEMELKMIEAAIDRNNGNKTAAAQDLGISVKTLYNRLSVLLGKEAA